MGLTVIIVIKYYFPTDMIISEGQGALLNKKEMIHCATCRVALKSCRKV